MKFFIKRFQIVFCILLLTAMVVLMTSVSAYCQSTRHLNIQAQVLDSGGGACRSGNHNLIFSLGQSSPVGLSQNNSQCVSAGFITSVCRQVCHKAKTGALPGVLMLLLDEK